MSIHIASQLIRGFSPEANRFVEGNSFPRKDGGVAVTEVCENEIKIHNVFPETITGYTGHSDRNGAPMYGGDILKIDFLPGLYYIYTTYRDKAEIASMEELAEKRDITNVTKTVIDLSGNVTSHMEVTGTILSSLIPRLMADYEKKNRQLTNIYEENNIDESEDIEFGFEPEVEIGYEEEELEPQNEPASEPVYDTKIRGLSMDCRTWLNGRCFRHTDSDDTKTFYMFNPETFKVSETIPETLGTSSDFRDKTGAVIFDGDVIVLEGKQAFVIRDKSEFGCFAIIEYNRYSTKAGLDIINWKPVDYNVWKTTSHDIEIIGDIYTGLSKEFLDEYTAGTRGYISNLQQLPEEEEDKITMNPVKELSYTIDSVIKSVRPDLNAFYYSDNNSEFNEQILHCIWKISESEEIHGFYNMHTGENSVHYGDYSPHPDYSLRHGMYMYSKDSFAEFIDALVNLILEKRTKEEILKDCVKRNSNIDSKTVPMRKGWSLERLLKETFNDASTVSQEDFRCEAIDLYTDKRFDKIATRALDCCGMWMTGIRVVTDPDEDGTERNYIRTYSKGEPYLDTFIASSACPNTFLQDKNGKYIFSCDIIDYDGKLYVVYMSDDINPNDALNLTSNDTGFMYIYYMEYDRLIHIIMNPEKLHRLEWNPINVTEWIRQRDKITVVSNITENPPLNPKICLNSSDFTHDDDPLPVMYKKEEIMYINETADALYFHNRNFSERENEEEITFVAENVMGLDLDDDNTGYVSRVFHASDRSKTRVKQITHFSGETAEFRLMWRTQNAFTVMLGHNMEHTESLGVLGFGLSYKETQNKFRDIMSVDNFSASIYYNVPFANPTESQRIIINKVIQECMDKKGEIFFETQGDYMDYLVSKGFPEGDFRHTQCRALTCYGEWVHGYLTPELDAIVDPRNGARYAYLRETLGFNTFMTDSAGKYIYDNDIVTFKGKGSQKSGLGENTMVVNRLSWLIYLDDVPVMIGSPDKKANKIALMNKIREPLVRCMYNSFSEGTIDADRSNVQFIPLDIAFFLRNSHRIIIVGDTYTNDPDIDEF